MSGDCSHNAYSFLVDEEETWKTGCLGGDSPTALLSIEGNTAASTWTCKPCRSTQAQFDDIELLREQVIFCQNGSRKQQNRQNTDCYGQIFHKHKLCLECLLYMCTKGPDTKGGQVTPLPGGLAAGQRHKECLVWGAKGGHLLPQSCHLQAGEETWSTENSTFASFTKGFQEVSILASKTEQLLPLSTHSIQHPKKSLWWCE